MCDEIKTYAEARLIIESGDIITCVGSTLHDKGINVTTGQASSHVMMARRDHNRLMAMEAISRGTVYRPLSLLADSKYDSLTLYRLADEETRLLIADQALSHGLDLLGRPYDFGQIGRIFFGEALLKKITGLADDPSELDSLICSEFVSAAYREAGVDLVPGKPDRFTYPGDFDKSPMLVKVCQFRF